MLPLLSALNEQRWYIRRPIKLLTFGGVVLVTLYPHFSILRRHIDHLRHPDRLTDPNDPAVAALRKEFNAFVEKRHADISTPASLNHAIERFVYKRVPYAWDWDTWGVADYLPTPQEVLDKGREDCDGRAVVAAALLRSFDVNARLAADPRHVWVHTPAGDLMNPLGKPVFEASDKGVKIRWRALIDPGPLAFGVAVFPFMRELIILLTVWLLVLPAGIDKARAMLVLIALLESLMVIRVAGADPMAPKYIGLALAAAQWPAVAWLLLRSRRRAALAPVQPA